MGQYAKVDGFITIEEMLLLINKNQEIKQNLEVYEQENAAEQAKEAAKNAAKAARKRLYHFFSELSKKVLFITSVPFYWFIIFKYLLGWFNAGFFMFVIVCSIVLSVSGGNWGLLHFGARW